MNQNIMFYQKVNSEVIQVNVNFELWVIRCKTATVRDLNILSLNLWCGEYHGHVDPETKWI